MERITGPLPEPKSSNDFLYKIEVVLEEADESHYWLEVVKGAQLHSGDALDKLIREANELTAIFAATDKTNKAKIKKSDIIDQK
ncbi:four helix bundle protein [Niabella drilacis]|uniref:four helix bundle protein n=1 Tax=Niabella drilacis (strain DSM 25811 / CCM 8410 / CCUG 62505 / LMG 26954 / E90) TaxID=1285928 RepID=UPI0021CFBC77|nr:four helix bundle protein [Niabella drilacis]